MKKIHVLVEGQTEERFIKDTLYPHFFEMNIFINPIIVTTKYISKAQNEKGGLPQFPKVKKQVQTLLADSSADLVTTMFDYYGLPESFPLDAKNTSSAPVTKAEQIEKDIENLIDHPKFKAYLSLHEFEALLYSDTSIISHTLMLESNPFQNKLDQFNSPEEINDDPKSAPSKRIIAVAPHYDKVLYGSRICGRIGLQKIRSKCRHFHEWLLFMERL